MNPKGAWLLFFLWLSIGGEGITRSDQNMDLCKSLVWACFSAKNWIANVSIFVSLSNAFLLQGTSRWKRSKIHVQRMLRLKKKSKFMKISEWKHVEDDLTRHFERLGNPTSSQRWMSPSYLRLNQHCLDCHPLATLVNAVQLTQPWRGHWVRCNCLRCRGVSEF